MLFFVPLGDRVNKRALVMWKIAVLDSGAGR
jgi:hypothetical protein